METESYTIKTGVDKLVDLVRERKRVSIDEAAKILSVPKVLVEEWADFLDEREVIGIEYKFAVPYLVYKEFTREEVEERAKQFAGRREGFVRKVDTVLQYLEQQSEALARLKAEFANMTKELESKVEHVKGELELLNKYEEMKRSIDSQIILQQREFDEKKEFIDTQIVAKKKAISNLLKQMDVEQRKLSKEESLVRLLKKDEAELEEELQSIAKKALMIEEKIKWDGSLINETVKKITDFKQLTETAKLEVQKQEELLAPLLAESEKHAQKIAELRQQFLSKVSVLQKNKEGLNREEVRAIRSKFEKLFAKKLSAERMVNKVNTDLEEIKKELKGLSEEATVVRLTSKSKKVSDYVKDFEQKFTILNKKKEKFQTEVYKLAGMLKKL